MAEKRLLRGLLAILSLCLAAARPAQPAAAAAAALVDAPWTIVAVDTADNVGQYASLAIDPDDNRPFVAYYDATHTDLRVAFLYSDDGNCGPGNSWHCETQPGFSATQGQYPSAAFRATGALAVAYYDGSNSMNRFNGHMVQGDPQPAWGRTVDNWPDYSGQPPTQTGRYNSMKFDAAGVAHIASQQSAPAPTALRYAKYVGSGGTGCNPLSDWDWACTTVEAGADNTGAFASLDLNWAGNPRIAYRGPNGQLKLALNVGSSGNCGGGAWQCDVIDAGANTGNYISLFVPKCYPASCGGLTSWIAYYDDGNDRLKVAKYLGATGGNCGFGGQAGAWQCSIIETVGDEAAMGVSLAMVDGQPVVAYYDADDFSNGILKIAYPAAGVGNCGPSNGLFLLWNCVVVDNGVRGLTTHDVGRYASLGVNDAGLATIAYYDSSFGDLLVAYQAAAQAPAYQVFVPIVVK